MQMGIVNKILKGSIIGITLLAVLLMAPGMASAMQFSQPVEIGAAWFGKGNGKIFTRKALPSSATDGSYYDFQGSKDIIRLWWNSYRIGSSTDSQNTVAVEIFKAFDPNKLLSGGGEVIEVLGSNGIVVYFWSTSPGMYHGNDFTVFGPNRQGKFVKYIDRKRCDEVSNGAVRGHYCGLKVQNDSLILNCSPGPVSKDSGRFLFKWDEKAQWFGIAFEKL